MCSLESRLVYQEAPAGETPPEASPVDSIEELDVLAAEYAPRFAEAIEKILPRQAEDLQAWSAQEGRLLEYDGHAYRVSFIDKVFKEGAKEVGRHVGLALTDEKSLSVGGLLLPEGLLDRQISIHRIAPDTGTEQGGRKPAYFVFFDTLGLGMELDMQLQDFRIWGKNEPPSKARLDDALSFIEVKLHMLVLAGEVEGSS